MMSAAPRCLKSGTLSSKSILECFQIEVASVNSNPLCCFPWDQLALRRLAGLRNSLYHPFPLVLNAAECSLSIASPTGVLEDGQLRSQIENVCVSRVNGR